MTTRERAAGKLCRFHPACKPACEECLGDVDAVLEEIRPAFLQPDGRSCDPTREGHDDAEVINDWIDAIKRGEG